MLTFTFRASAFNDENGSRQSSGGAGDDEWLAVGLSRFDRDALRAGLGFSKDGAAANSVSSLAAVIERAVDFVAVLNPQMRLPFEESIRVLLDEIAEATFIALVPRRTAPEDDEREDDTVTSFACSASVLKSLLSIDASCPPDRICFSMLRAILDGEIEVDKILIRQLPCRSKSRLSYEEPFSAALIMAHRGEPHQLQTALRFIARAAKENLCVRVGLDVDRPGEYETFAAEHSGVEFFKAHPPPVGPYVIRQELAHRSNEPLLIFHDSDDISCEARFTILREQMRETGSDLIGSHELRVDDLQQRVIALRFPLDVSKALCEQFGHPLLHPTSMVRRDRFFAVGGFSTDQKISNDVQFLLRAYFALRVRNVDEFLYIRRRHRSALTVAPETELSTPLRLRLKQMWRADFEAVKSGRMSLEQSSLRWISGSGEYRISPFKER